MSRARTARAARREPVRPTEAPIVPAALAGPTPAAGEARQRMIAEAAYFRAQQRGFEPGHELEDWLAAEAQFDAIAPGAAPTPSDVH